MNTAKINRIYRALQRKQQTAILQCSILDDQVTVWKYPPKGPTMNRQELIELVATKDFDFLFIMDLDRGCIYHSGDTGFLDTDENISEKLSVNKPWWDESNPTAAQIADPAFNTGN